jgi:hypothetical protein
LSGDDNQRANEKLHLIKPGMTEKEVTGMLGMPERSVGHTVRWEASRGVFDAVRVEVVFDQDRRVGSKKLDPTASITPSLEPVRELKYDPKFGIQPD